MKFIDPDRGSDLEHAPVAQVRWPRPSIADCVLIDLPRFTDSRGSLTFLEAALPLPFEFKRLFYVYDLAPEARRGAHAHRTCHEFIVCVSGSVDVVVDDGRERRSFRLDRPWQGLHVPPMVWAAEDRFAPNTVYLVLASKTYDPADYIRDYGEYVAEATSTAGPSES